MNHAPWVAHFIGLVTFCRFTFTGEHGGPYGESRKSQIGNNGRTPNLLIVVVDRCLSGVHLVPCDVTHSFGL
jgi:hypothetical protein